MESIHQRILAHIARHVSLTAAEQELFISLIGIRRLLRKQFLLQAGDVCRYESYVLDGCLRSFFVDDKGDEHTLHFALEDWWITDLESFLHQTAAQVNIEALTPVTADSRPGEHRSVDTSNGTAAGQTFTGTPVYGSACL